MRQNQPGAARPIGHLRLALGDGKEGNTVATSLSAVEQVGKHLFLGADETASFERITTIGHSDYADHISYPLADFFPLPAGPASEADIEGLAYDPKHEHLWIMGSHSLRRGKPNQGASGIAAAAALARTDRQANRYLLGRVKLQRARKGDADKEIPSPDSAACVPFLLTQSTLVDLIATNSVLRPFIDLPSKDNGLDIEGLAVRDGVVYLGLRGPVVRGWASIIQMRPRSGRDVAGNRSLEIGQVDGKGYLHHLLDLSGLGIRDLCVWDKDLLILAGPTMELDGPIVLYRWRNAFDIDHEVCLDDGRLEPCFEIPWGSRADHAEGIALYRRKDDDVPSLLVVYDSPKRSRLHDGRYFEADLFALPSG